MSYNNDWESLEVPGHLSIVRENMSLLENEAVERARSGDREALERLLYDNYEIVYGYLYRLTMNEEAAKDFTQETMVKAITNIRGFRGGSKFSTWLVAIASNVFRDSARKSGRMSDTAIEDIPLAAPGSVEDTVVGREEAGRLKAALAALPEEKRMAFVLKHFYGYSYGDIAGILKCPVGTVRSRLHYCLVKLQEALK